MGPLPGGSLSALSLRYMVKAILTWRKFDWHPAMVAFCFAFDSAGKSMAARMAMMAMTTNSSIKVNAFRFSVLCEFSDMAFM